MYDRAFGAPERSVTPKNSAAEFIEQEVRRRQEASKSEVAAPSEEFKASVERAEERKRVEDAQRLAESLAARKAQKQPMQWSDPKQPRLRRP